MATILFTDADGAWKLHNGKPWPASRFQNWHPDSLPFGDSAPRLSDGAITMFRLRDDFGVMFELPMIPSKRSTNLVLQSENFGTTWTTNGTPTRTAAAHTTSGVTLDLIGDDTAAGTEGYEQNITFTGDGTKAVSVFVRRSTAASSVIRVSDITAGNSQLLGAISWDGSGLPVLTMVAGAFLGYGPLADGVFRLLLQAQDIVAANVNRVDIYPASTIALDGTQTGTLYSGGVQAEDAATPTPYLHNTTAARSGVSMVEIADRLKYHLLNGGTCAVYTNDAAASSYATCGLKPGTVPQLSLSDRRAMEFTLSLQLVNLAAVPVRMLAHYNEQ